MSVFPLSERELLYVWKVVRVVIQGGCRRCCMLAAMQTVENGPRLAVSRAFVCLCLTRRLLVHRSTVSTHLAKEQSSHYQPYLIPTQPPLTDTQGQTVAGLSRSALPGGLWCGHWSGLGGPLNTQATPSLWTNINTIACGAGLPRWWEKTEYSASSDKEREGFSSMGHWQLKRLPKLPCETQHPFYFVSQTLHT